MFVKTKTFPHFLYFLRLDKTRPSGVLVFLFLILSLRACSKVRDFGSCTAVIEHAVNTFGGIDILINCAAGNFLSPAEGLSPKGFRVVMEIDAFGCFHMSQVRTDLYSTAAKLLECGWITMHILACLDNFCFSSCFRGLR